MKNILFSLSVLVPFLMPVGSASLRGAEEAVQKENDLYLNEVKPLLMKHCVSCHGPDRQQGGLRVDAGALLLQGGDAGTTIIQGKSAESTLWQAVAHTGDVLEMPYEQPKLTDVEIAVFKRWIDAGALFPKEEPIVAARKISSDHWSFQPVQRPEVPELPESLAGHVRNQIDAFVLSKLADAGLSPSPAADRRVLIRRVSLDLIGLLPTPDEVAQFLTDDQPGAYERLVDRLLASPHYGERWGRHWLDAARYADSNGFTIDGPRSMWPYRDWVVNALNEDVPFDRFTIEQLAGDMLPNATLSQRVATGFHRNTLANEEGGTSDEQFRVEAVIDRVSTTGVVWMGLTIGCAQCHDHKFDPVSQRDFYRMYAVFNNTVDNNDAAGQAPKLAIPDSAQSARQLQLTALLSQSKVELLAREKLLDAMPDDSTLKTAASATRMPDWSPIAEADVIGSAGSQFKRRDDGAFVVTSAPPNHEDYEVRFAPETTQVSGFQLEVLPDSTLASQGPGLAGNGNFVLTDVVLYRETADGTREAISIAEATADHAQKDYPISSVLDGKSDTGWAINGAPDGIHSRRVATFQLKDVVELEASQKLVVVLRHRREANLKYQIGCFRLSLTSEPFTLVALAQPLVDAVNTPKERRSPAQQKLVSEHRRQLDAEWLKLKEQIDTTTKQLDTLNKSIPTSLVLQELPQPRESFVHLRGDFLSRGAIVAPGVPAVLPQPEASPDAIESRPLNRLDFARWLVDANHPLTARVQVNRVWQAYFGKGLVDTENDFGLQGSRPTHPELLDWLAAEFVAKKWSLKALHRLIITSGTYRQSSHVAADQLAIDPANRWLARQSRIRLEAEVVRDAALSASGLFTPAIGGPPVYPPQPDGIYAFTQNRKAWPEEQGPNRYRRGLYTYIWRTSPHPMMPTFDAPDSNVTCTRRVRSNTPLQALTLANDRGLFELAQGLAQRTIQMLPNGSDESRLSYAMQCALSREPNENEQAILLQYLQSQRQSFIISPQLANQVAPAKLRGEISAIEFATWSSVSRVLMNLDEFITRE